MSISPGEKVIMEWLRSKGWKMAAFQQESVSAYLSGKNGLINAPTGTGKTFAAFFPIVIDYINNNPDYRSRLNNGLQALWITPLRALTIDIRKNLTELCGDLELPWTIGIRTGDATAKERAAQRKQLPEVLLITPESMHLIFAQKNHRSLFKKLCAIVIDEWHELMGSKRGVQTELALSRLRTYVPGIRTWGMSATIGNLEQAMEVMLGRDYDPAKAVIIKSDIRKKIVIRSLIPDKIEKLPWAGHLGINLLDKVMEVVNESPTTLIFTNTRSQTEIWYRTILDRHPELAGIIALHHGSLDREIRSWVEDALHREKLKVVVCTSSLDLGVDFRPVETVIQVGSPKSISRFLQRAGRSGHQPGATSTIYFVPTHTLELIEAVSLREGVTKNMIEERVPVVNAFDVLAQYMVTLAVGDGFEEKALYEEVLKTHAYHLVTRSEWEWLLGYITTGGPTLIAYDEFRKVEKEGDLFVVKDRRIAMRHRLNMGTIVSDASLRIKYLSGKYLGSIEENFISRLKPGDVFSFAGMNLSFVRVREMTVQVVKAGSAKGAIPRWNGGRMPLSSQLSAFIRRRLDGAYGTADQEPEIQKLQPIFALQAERSIIPRHNQLLIEQCKTREGNHIFMFPFEGRLVHEGMAAVIAYRISRIQPVTFSLAMNDYGFELLSDDEIDMNEILGVENIFTTVNLLNDIQQSVNATEMSKRKFREIAAIAGLIFQGYPGKSVKTRHLQASSSLLFDVIREHDPGNLLVRQAYQEALDQQMEEQRMRTALQRITDNGITIMSTELPTPFAFPIMVDRLREQVTSEKLDDRIGKLLRQFEKRDGVKSKR